jgi:hypothetical protein
MELEKGKPMRKPLRPVTVEMLALLVERAGQLAAAIIRERPDEAPALAFGLFETVMLSFSHAVETGAVHLLESDAYDEFSCAWSPALKNAMQDLLPDQVPLTER